MKKNESENAEVFNEYYVDIPQLGSNVMLNVESFETRQQAIDYAKENFGADNTGRLSLVSPEVVMLAKTVARYFTIYKNYLTAHGLDDDTNSIKVDELTEFVEKNIHKEDWPEYE